MRINCDIEKYALLLEDKSVTDGHETPRQVGTWRHLLSMPTPAVWASKRSAAYRTPKCPIPEIVLLADYANGLGSDTIAKKHSAGRCEILRSLEVMGLRRARGKTMTLRSSIVFETAPVFVGDWTGSSVSIEQDIRANLEYDFAEENAKKQKAKALARYYANHEARKKRNREYAAKRWAAMTDEQKEKTYKRRPRKTAEYSRRWYAKNKDKCRKARLAWIANNKDKVRQYRRNNDKKPHNRMVHSIRNRLRNLIGYKGRAIIPIIGCSTSFLREHIEKQFKPGMSWDNYGPKGWHLDHIKPLSRFNLKEWDQVQLASHWTNLQPLWWHENLAKSDKWEEAA